jgi:hypothetical protein
MSDELGGSIDLDGAIDRAVAELEKRVIRDNPPPSPEELRPGHRIVVHGILSTSKRHGFTFKRGRAWSEIDADGNVLVTYRSDWEFAEREGLPYRVLHGGWHPPTPETRCRAKSIHTGKQCVQRQLGGGHESGFCGFHYKRHGRAARSAMKVRRDRGIPAVYRERLSGALRERFDTTIDTGSRALDLWEELAMFRVIAQQAVSIYDKAEATGEAKAIIPASAFLVEALKQVERCVSQITANRVKITGALQQVAVGAMIHQVVDVAYQVFGDSEENMLLVERFAEKIRSEVDAPQVVSGVRVSPEVEVRGMIESVPTFDDDGDDEDEDLPGDGVEV